MEPPAETDRVDVFAPYRMLTFVWGDLRSTDQRRYLDFVASCFETEPPAYAATFPLAFAAESRALFVALNGVQGPVAILSITPLLFQHESVSLSAACLGSVCVRSQHRGQGHAQALLRAAVVKAQARGVDFLCLFASDQRLYAANGFMPAGQDGLFALSALAKNPEAPFCDETEMEWQYRAASDLSVQESSNVWRSLERWRQSPAAVLSLCDFHSVMKAKPMGILMGSVQHRLRAVLFFEKGVDFIGTWHGAGADGPVSFARILQKAAQIDPVAQVHLVGAQLQLFRDVWPHLPIEVMPSMMVRPLTRRAVEWLGGAQIPVVTSLLSN